MKRWETILVILSSAIILLAGGYYAGFLHCRIITEPVLYQAEPVMNNQAEIIHSQDLYIEALELYRDLIGIDNQVLRNENDALRQTNSQLKFVNNGLELARAKRETTLNDFEAIPVIREVEKVVEVFKPAKDWESLTELKAFINEHKDEVLVRVLAGRDGVAQTSGQCVGRVMGWRDLAALYGKNLEMEDITPAERLKWFGVKKDEKHEVIKAILKDGSEIYYIDAETLEIKLTGYVP